MKKKLLIALTMVIGLAFAYAVQAGGTYVGAAKCKGCHAPIYAAWAESPHAKAFEALEKAGKAGDAKCVKCHQTGPGGDELKGVQCEACHGAGSEYKKPSIMSKSKYKADKAGAHDAAVKAGLVVPDEKVCVTCHTKEGNDNFKPFKFADRKAIVLKAHGK